MADTSQQSARLLPSQLDAIEANYDYAEQFLPLFTEIRACWAERDDLLALAASGVAVCGCGDGCTDDGAMCMTCAGMLQESAGRLQGRFEMMKRELADANAKLVLYDRYKDRIAAFAEQGLLT